MDALITGRSAAFVYRSLFALFGFTPYPTYVVFFAALLVNLWLAYLVLSRIGGSREIGVIATLVWAFHGKLDYLYYNAGSMYDAFCFLFYFLALLIYLRARLQGPDAERLGNRWVSRLLHLFAQLEGNGRDAAGDAVGL